MFVKKTLNEHTILMNPISLNLQQWLKTSRHFFNTLK